MDKIALTNVRAFDGERLLEPATVVIDGDRIGDDQEGARTWEGDGGVLLPGLIDCHIHLTDESTLAALARQGVTTALDMGTDSPELVASLRNRPGVTDVRSSGASATRNSWPSCSSIWTISRPSTTASGTWPATDCSWPPPCDWWPASGRRIPWPAWAATNSPC